VIRRPISLVVGIAFRQPRFHHLPIFRERDKPLRKRRGNVILPSLTYHGFLPEGVHCTNLLVVRDRFATNPLRVELYQKLEKFLHWASTTGQFSCAYIDGGFVTNKAEPSDIDVILQTSAPYGAAAFHAMEPFFAQGIDSIYEIYSVHLHFWCEGFPGAMTDFRRFFQYLRPQDAAPSGLNEAARKGIIRVDL